MKNVLIIATLLLIIPVKHLLAQEPIEEITKAGWGMIGLGVNSAGPTASGIISYQRKTSLFSVRANYGEEFDFCFFGSCSPDISGDISLMYGVVGSKDRIKGSVSFGPAYAFGSRSGTPAFGIFGVAMDGQVFVMPKSNGVGVGLNGYIDINAKASFVGLSLCLVIYFDNSTITFENKRKPNW